MSLSEAFESGTEAVFLDLAQRPRAPKPQDPSFSLWGLVKAGPRALAAGAGEAIASGLELADGFSKVDISPDAMADSMTEEGRARQQKKAQQTLREGFTGNELTISLRNVAKDYMPDPVTAHGAEQAVADLFRLGGKAVAAGLTLGPLGGAAAAGLEEGFTASQALADKGVDVATRTKVGAVTAAFTAGSFAIPVAGKTMKSTVGLALAGGPLTFSGQNYVTREILQNADYSKLADQYDPFDPVGLALSTLLPLGFGAVALRAAGKGAKAREAGGAAEAARVDEGAPSQVATTIPDPEAVDAARVNLLRENVENSRLTEPSDLPGAAAHDATLSKAIDQMAAGERVDVSGDVSTNVVARIADELEPRLARLADEMGAGARAVEAAPIRAVEPVAAQQTGDVAAPAQAVTPEASNAIKLVSESPQIDRASNLIEAERPDMLIQLDGMDAPMRMADLMKQVRDDLGRDLQESPLIEAAATCFVSS